MKTLQRSMTGCLVVVADVVVVAGTVVVDVAGRVDILWGWTL